MKTMNADVIVAAAGLSGLAACVSAAQQGLKVITFEKGKITLDNSAKYDTMYLLPMRA